MLKLYFYQHFIKYQLNYQNFHQNIKFCEHSVLKNQIPIKMVQKFKWV